MMTFMTIYMQIVSVVFTRAHQFWLFKLQPQITVSTKLLLRSISNPNTITRNTIHAFPRMPPADSALLQSSSA